MPTHRNSPESHQTTTTTTTWFGYSIYHNHQRRPLSRFLGRGETTTRPLSLTLFLPNLTTDNTTHKNSHNAKKQHQSIQFKRRQSKKKKSKREKNCCWCSRLGGRLRANGYRRYRTRLTSTSTPTNLDGIVAPALFNNTIGLQVVDLSVREPTPPMYSVLCFVCATVPVPLSSPYYDYTLCVCVATLGSWRAGLSSLDIFVNWAGSI